MTGHKIPGNSFARRAQQSKLGKNNISTEAAARSLADCIEFPATQASVRPGAGNQNLHDSPIARENTRNRELMKVRKDNNLLLHKGR